MTLGTFFCNSGRNENIGSQTSHSSTATSAKKRPSDPSQKRFKKDGFPFWSNMAMAQNYGTNDPQK